MKKKVLILTYDMVPYSVSWGGCQRMFYVANSLEENEFDVDVICIKKKNFGNYGHLPNFNVIAFPYHNAILSRVLKNSILDTNKPDSQKGDTEKTKASRQSVAKKIISSSFFLKIIEKTDRLLYNDPNVTMGLISETWIKGVQREILQTIKSSNYNIILVSGPPFGFFTIIEKIKDKFNDIPLIIDYRDPWNMWKRGSFITVHKENKYLSLADKIVFTNENLARDTAKAFNLSKKEIMVISNGYSSEDWNKIKDYKSHSNAFPSPLVISYIGSITFGESNKFRNPDKFLSAVEKCWEEGMQIIVQFIGIKHLNDNRILALETKYKDRIRFIGEVPSSDSLKFMLDSNVLLLLHTAEDGSSRYIISGKLYDYIHAGKYILSISDERSSHATILRETSAGINVKNEICEIYNTISSIYSRYQKGKLSIPSVPFENFSRDYQNSKYVELFNTLMKKSV